MAYRARNILIAVALAAVAALLTSFYVTSYKRHVQRSEDHVTVLVAKHDIDPGTTGGDAAHMLTSQTVPRRSVVPGAISSPDQIAGLVATQKTLEGEQVTTRRFHPRAQDGGQTGSASQGNGAGWSLQLRPVVHADDSPESVTTLDSVLRDGLSSSQLKKYRGVFGGGQ